MTFFLGDFTSQKGSSIQPFTADNDAQHDKTKMEIKAQKKTFTDIYIYIKGTPDVSQKISTKK